MQLLITTYSRFAARTPEDDVHQLLSLPPVLVVDVTVPGSARLLVFLSMPVLASREEADVCPRTFAQTVSNRAIAQTRTQALIH